MRRLFILLCLCLAGLAPSVRAQSEADASRLVAASVARMRVITDLNSLDNGVRNAALKEITFNAANYPPLAFSFAANALAKNGDAEGALLWAYFGEIRARTDVALLSAQDKPIEDWGDLFEPAEWRQGKAMGREARVPIAPERRFVVLQKAIKKDKATPRRYSTIDYLEEYSVQTAWPSPKEVAAARRAAVASTRERVAASIQRDARFAEIDAAISGNRPSEAAIALIPPSWRERVRARKTVAMPDDCTANRPVLASPVGQPSFVLMCHATAPSHCPALTLATIPGLTEEQNCSLSYRWISANDGSTISDAAYPISFDSFGAIVARGDNSYVLMRRRFGKRDGYVLVAPSGVATEMTPARIQKEGGMPGVANVFDPIAVSRSANLLALRNGDGGGVFDVEASQWAWVDAGGAFAFFDDAKGELEAVVFVRHGQCDGALRCRNSQIVRKQVSDGAEQSIALPFAIEARRRVSRYDDDHAIVLLVDDADEVALVNLRTLRIDYRGARLAAPPPLQRSASCGDPQPSSYRFVDRPLRFVLGAESFELPLNSEGTSCTISSDQNTLLIVDPPYLHFYDLRYR